ncbi:MAG: hypothetical protein HDR81_06095 [Bacteroides sp.]|nr:hypothetical protein [Bacteroides sp.]MBD5362362.1 hypothetical protein [Bacteroides sp.]
MKINRDKYSLLYLISAAEMIIFLLLMPLMGREPSDTVTYFSAFDTLCSGRLDSFRTPLYPLFIGSLRAVLGSAPGRICAVMIQIFVFLCSISWFRKLAESFLSNHTVAFWLTAIYALYPGPLTLNSCLLTESFAFSGMTALLWLTYKAYARADIKAAWGAVGVLLLLIFLRPAFIFLPIVVGFFWLIAVFCKQSRHTALISIAGAAISIVALGLYSLEIKRLYNVMAPSTVSSCNNYFTIRGANLVTPSPSTPNPRLKASIDSILSVRLMPGTIDETWTEIQSLRRAASLTDVADYVSQTMASAPKECMKFILTERLAQALRDDATYGGYVLPPVRALTKLFAPNIGAAMALLLIFCIIASRRDLRKHKFSFLNWLMASLALAIISTSIIGAQNEWQRLILPAYPILLLILGSVFIAAARKIQN